MAYALKTVPGHRVNLSFRVVDVYIIYYTSSCTNRENFATLTGFKFGKVGSRKSFAVREGELKSSRKRAPVVISDSDSDDDLRPLGRKRKDNAIPPEAEEDIKEMRRDIQFLLQNSDKMNISPILYRQLRDTFQCHICHSTPIVPPVIFSRCCHRLLGCPTCVDGWYGGEDGMSCSCPICRFERAYSETTTVRGLDDFLKVITPLLATAETEPAASETVTD